MSSETIVMSKKEMLALANKFPHKEVRKTPPYALYQIKVENCILTAYTSGKLVIQGKDAQAIRAILGTPKQTIAQQAQALYPQCGSDEVGTGDYFGPITVCACCVKEADIPFLKALHIQDSKAIRDPMICHIAPQLMERLPYSLLIMDNETYNRVHPNQNMVAIKSKLHNCAYAHLEEKLHGLPAFCIIDQFVQKSTYYRYIAQEKTIVKNIHFETKAENKYLSVACASIIARYAFVKRLDTMSEQYDFTFVKGASAKVDAAIVEFVKRYGKDALTKVGKLHFANTKKAFINETSCDHA